MELLSTAQMAEHIGAHPATVRLYAPRIPGATRNERGQWMLPATSVEAARRLISGALVGRKHRTSPLNGTGHRALQNLAEWGNGTADELAIAMQVHPGNVRKTLAIAAGLGLTARDGQNWSVTDSGRRWLTEHAQEVAA